MDLSFVVLSHDAGSDLDVLTELQHARKNRATGHATLEVFDLRAGFVDVEGTNDDKAWWRGEVPNRHRDPFDDVFVDGVNVVLQLCRDWDDRR